MPVARLHVCTAVLPCLLLVSVATCVRAATVTPPSHACLDDAWQFACAITNDANDRAASQAKVARAWLDAGDPARALKTAAEISDWRRLAITADAAAWWAERGKTNEAMRALLEAQHLAPGVKDWPYDRVQMHLARVKALLGMKSDLDVLADVYRDSRDCSGAVHSARALEAARRGAVDEALACLEQISKIQHLDLMSARAAGFRELAANHVVSAEQSARLLKVAWDSTCEVPGWRKVDLQLDLVDALQGSRLEGSVRDYLTKLTDGLMNDPYPDHIRAVRLAEVAVRWGRICETKKVAQLEAEATKLMRAKMELIEQPAVLARLAEAHAAAGEKKKAEALFSEAMEITAGLLNSRPRALAAVDVALAQARSGLDSQQFTTKRNAMIEGLGGRVR